MTLLWLPIARVNGACGGVSTVEGAVPSERHAGSTRQATQQGFRAEEHWQLWTAMQILELACSSPPSLRPSARLSVRPSSPPGARLSRPAPGWLALRH